MDTLPAAIETLTLHVTHIKWLAVALLVILIIGLMVVLYLLASFRKLFRIDPVATRFRSDARLLLNMNDLDGLEQLAKGRIDQFPGEIIAHWYLGLAYYRKKEWHKALAEFNHIYDIEPAWRYKHLNPYIYDIKEQLKNTRPEIIKK